MTSVDEILASSPLSGLRRISRGGGDRKVTAVRLAERFAELDDAPADSFVVLSRVGLGRDHRLPAGHGPALGGDQRRGRGRGVRRREWQPAVTALDIAGPAEIALVSIPADADLVALARAIFAEIGGGAGQALGRAQQGLEAVQRAEAAGTGAARNWRRIVQPRELGTPVAFLPACRRGRG